MKNNLNLKVKIYVAGHRGMVGSAILRKLKLIGCKNIIVKNRKELDLTNQLAVENFFKKEKPDQVYLAAARVGGIYSNYKFPAEFIYQNLMIEANIIHYAWLYGVKKILYLGSSCIYPKNWNQPFKEKFLLSGKLEPTNEPYAIAKIAGIKLCESYNRQYGKSYGVDYRTIIPPNLYGFNDNYDLKNSHVVAALIKKFYKAKKNKKNQVMVWGSGNPKREFMYVDDAADAAVYIMSLKKSIYKKYTQEMQSHINVGTGKDMSIKVLAKKISKIIGYNGKIKFNTNKLDGTKRKLMSSTLVKKMGWKIKSNFEKNLNQALRNYIKTLEYK